MEGSAGCIVSIIMGCWWFGHARLVIAVTWRNITHDHVGGGKQCSKLLPVRQPEADNFGGGPVTFLKLFFNFMFMIWDSRQQDWQLFWLSFEHWGKCKKIVTPLLTHWSYIFLALTHQCMDSKFRSPFVIYKGIPNFAYDRPAAYVTSAYSAVPL